MHVDRRIASRLSRCHPYKPPQKSPCYFRQSFLHQEGNLKVEPSRSQYLDKDESRNRTREPDHERGCRAPTAARSPLRETKGRDGPLSSFSCTAQGNDGKGPSLPVILPVSGGASAPKQARRGRAGQEEERRDRAFLQKSRRTSRATSISSSSAARS